MPQRFVVVFSLNERFRSLSLTYINRKSRKPGHSFPSSTEGKNVWSCTYTPLKKLMMRTWILSFWISCREWVGQVTVGVGSEILLGLDRRLLRQLCVGATPCSSVLTVVDCVWNVMAEAQKPDFVFRRNGPVHLNRRERQFSRLLTAELCASGVVMLDAPCSEVVWRVLATHSIRQFPLHFLSRASPCAITFQLDCNDES